MEIWNLRTTIMTLSMTTRSEIPKAYMALKKLQRTFLNSVPFTL